MTGAGPWPRHLDELGDAWRQPTSLVGNGPFLLSEFATTTVLDANPLLRWCWRVRRFLFEVCGAHAEEEEANTYRSRFAPRAARGMGHGA